MVSATSDDDISEPVFQFDTALPRRSKTAYRYSLPPEIRMYAMAVTISIAFLYLPHFHFYM